MKTLKIPVSAVAAMVACLAFAKEAVVKDICWRYSHIGLAVCIEGFGNMPEKRGKSVEELNEKMLAKIRNKSLAIPSKIDQYTVVAIGENAFMMPDGPSSITVPATVTSIGLGAFSGNKNLKSVTLPSKLDDIPACLFQQCEKLASVKMPSSMRKGSVIGSEAFADCKSLKTVVIPDGIRKIEKQAFRDCPNLVLVRIPASVISIDEETFVRCDKLAKIDVAKGNSVYACVDGELCAKDGVETIKRMKTIRLPKMDFKPPATIGHAVEWFVKASLELDNPDASGKKRGFHFAFHPPKTGPIPVLPVITASDISLYDAIKKVCDAVGYTFEVSGESQTISIRPAAKSTQEKENRPGSGPLNPL